MRKLFYNNFLLEVIEGIIDLSLWQHFHVSVEKDLTQVHSFYRLKFLKPLANFRIESLVAM